jgi:hypothetical protein
MTSELTGGSSKRTRRDERFGLVRFRSCHAVADSVNAYCCFRTSDAISAIRFILVYTQSTKILSIAAPG